MRKLTVEVEDIVEFETTDEMLFETIDAKMKIDSAIGDMRDIIIKSDPLVLSATHDILWSYFCALPPDKNGMAEQLDSIITVCEELKERAAKGLGVIEKGAPRIMAILPAGHSDPRLEHLIGEGGIALVAPDGNLKLDYEPKGVCHSFPDVRLAIDIGGKDSKGLKINCGKLEDFIMIDNVEKDTSYRNFEG